MRDSINEAISLTVTDMLEADLDVSFTQKELKKTFRIFSYGKKLF